MAEYDIKRIELPNGDICNLSSAGQFTVTSSEAGQLAHFEDGADGIPMKQLFVNIEPSQDLHGYSNPWPAGGGKNLLVPTVRTVTSKGITYTANADGSISLSGTATGDENFTIVRNTSAQWTGPVSALALGGKEGIYFTFGGIDVATNGGTKTLSTNITISRLRIKVTSGTTTNVTIKVQVESGSTAPTQWTPYSNICPITGWENVKVTRAGKNLANGTFGNQVPSISNGQMVSANGWSTPFIKIDNAKEYTFSFSGSAGRYVLFYDSTQIYLGSPTNIPNGYHLSSYANYSQAEYIKLRSDAGSGQNPQLQLELGTIATAYEPYTAAEVTIPLGSTVYGGTLDVTTGVLTVDRAMMDLGTLTWTYNNTSYSFGFFNSSAISSRKVGRLLNALCSRYAVITGNRSNLLNGQISSYNETNANAVCVRDEAYTDAATFKTAMNGVKLVYELATPTIVHLTPKQVTTLLKNNNVWSDAGTVDLTYYKNTQVSYELSDKLGWKSIDQFERLRPEQTWQLDGVSNSQGMACDGTYIYVTHREDAVPTTPMKISRYLLPDMTYVDTHTVGTGHYNNLYYYEGKLYASGGSHYLDSENNPKDDYTKVAVVDTSDWSYEVKDSPDNWGIGVRKFRNYQGWNGKTGTEGAPDPNKGYITALWASSRRDIMFYASYFTDPTNKQTPLTRITLDYTGCTSMQGSFHMTDYYFWTFDTAWVSGNTQSGHQVLRCFSYSGMLIKAFYLDGVGGVVGELEDLWVSDDDRTCYINTIDGRIFKFALPNLYHTLASTIYVGNTLKPGTIKHVYSYPQRRDVKASWPRGNYSNTVTGAFFLSDFTFLYEVGTFISPTLWVNERPLKGTFNEGYGTLWFQGSYNWTGGGRLSYAFRFTRVSDDPYNYYYYLSKFIANGKDDSTSPATTININVTSDGSFGPDDPLFVKLADLYGSGWLFGDMYVQDLSYIVGIPNSSTDLAIIN